MVSTRKSSIDCMRRISVGLLKKPVKTINAEKSNKVIKGDFAVNAAPELAMKAA